MSKPTFTIDQINTSQFQTTKLGGYKKEQVDEFVATLKDEYAKVIALLEKASSFERKAALYDEHYQALQDSLNEVQLTKTSIVEAANIDAQKIKDAAYEEARRVRAAAENEAETLRVTAAQAATDLANEVQADTQKMIRDSKQMATEILDDASRTAEGILKKIEAERQLYETQHNRMKHYLADLTAFVNDDSWLTAELVAKSATLGSQEVSDKPEVEKEDKPSTPQTDAQADVTPEQARALASLDAIQQQHLQLIEQAAVASGDENSLQQAAELLKNLKHV